jgi:protease-4
VISARVILEPLLDRFGVNVEVVKRGGRADMLSPNRRLDPGERDAVERQLEDIYRSFLRVVAQGRGREIADIEPLAGGRVWSGRDAHARGLVDHIGGFDQALTLALERLEPRLRALEPELLSASHWRPKRGFVPRLAVGLARSWFWGGLGPLATIALMLAGSARRERAYLFCGTSETDLGD